MKIYSLLLLLTTLSFSSLAQKNTPPPKDSTGKDFGYYYTVPFDTLRTWNETVTITKKYLDSFFVNNWKMIRMDSVNRYMKIRLTSKLKSRGMLKTTHKPVYSKCLLTYDYYVFYTETGLNVSVKRLVHYYTFTEEDPKMNMGASRSMSVKSKDVIIPLIQTDLGLYTKKALAEANTVVLKTNETYKTFGW